MSNSQPIIAINPINYQLVLIIVITLILILNLTIYYHEPQRYRHLTQCGALSCHNFTLLITIIALVVDIALITSIMKLIQLPYIIPVSIGIIIIIIILLEYYQTHQKIKKSNLPIKPPDYQFNQRIRLTIIIIILLAQIFVFTSRYILEYIPTLNLNPTLFQNLVSQRFGGYYPNNKFRFITSWFVLSGISISIYRLQQIAKKEADPESNLTYYQQGFDKLRDPLKKIKQL